MTFDEYQKAAHNTAAYPTVCVTPSCVKHIDATTLAWVYPALGLSGETGELLNKLKKILRDNPTKEATEEQLNQIGHELGDILWYITELATVFGLPLDLIAQSNIDKLQSRQERGKIAGSGDNR